VGVHTVSPSPPKERYVTVTDRDAHVRWLEHGLGPDAEILVVEEASLESVVRACDDASSNVVFVSFDPADPRAGSSLVRELVRQSPRLGVIAIGEKATPEVLLAAMRAGARDFADLASAPAAVREAVERVATSPALEPRTAAEGVQLAVLCGRPDVATSTFSVHLALACLEAARPGEEVLLVDLGQPSSDSLLFLDLVPSYTFLDAARSVRRFDQTLVQTAFARHKSGLAVLPLPDDAAEIGTVPMADTLALFGALKHYFRYSIVNLGGLHSSDFLLQALARVDRKILIADQAVVSCAAAHKLVEALAARGVVVGDFELLVDRYTERLEPNAERIAELLGVKLLGTLPPNGFELLRAMNLAQSVFESAPRSPYGAGVRSVAAGVLGLPEPTGPQTRSERVVQRVRSVLGMARR
jgi:pilus assembly protein CpaE